MRGALPIRTPDVSLQLFARMLFEKRGLLGPRIEGYDQPQKPTAANDNKKTPE